MNEKLVFLADGFFWHGLCGAVQSNEPRSVLLRVCAFCDTVFGKLLKNKWRIGKVDVLQLL